MFDEDEWLLITDDADPEQVWQDEKTEGWSIEVGPSIVHAEVPGQPARRARVYVLRRRVQ